MFQKKRFVPILCLCVLLAACSAATENVTAPGQTEVPSVAGPVALASLEQREAPPVSFTVLSHEENPEPWVKAEQFEELVPGFVKYVYQLAEGTANLTGTQGDLPAAPGFGSRVISSLEEYETVTAFLAERRKLETMDALPVIYQQLSTTAEEFDAAFFTEHNLLALDLAWEGAEKFSSRISDWNTTGDGIFHVNIQFDFYSGSGESAGVLYLIPISKECSAVEVTASQVCLFPTMQMVPPEYLRREHEGTPVTLRVGAVGKIDITNAEGAYLDPEDGSGTMEVLERGASGYGARYMTFSYRVPYSEGFHFTTTAAQTDFIVGFGAAEDELCSFAGWGLDTADFYDNCAVFRGDLQDFRVTVDYVAGTPEDCYLLLEGTGGVSVLTVWEADGTVCFLLEGGSARVSYQTGSVSEIAPHDLIPGTVCRVTGLEEGKPAFH